LIPDRPFSCLCTLALSTISLKPTHYHHQDVSNVNYTIYHFRTIPRRTQDPRQRSLPARTLKALYQVIGTLFLGRHQAISTSTRINTIDLSVHFKHSHYRKLAMNLLRKAYSKIKRTAAKTSDKIKIPKTPSQIKSVLTSFLPTEPMTQPKIPYTPFSNPQPHSIIYRNPPTVPTRSTPTRRHFVRKARNRQALAEEIEEKTRELVEQGIKVRDFQAEADAEKEQE